MSEPVLNPLQRSSHKNPDVIIITPPKNLEHREARLQVAQQVVGRNRTQTQAAENSKLLFLAPVVKFCDWPLSSKKKLITPTRNQEIFPKKGNTWAES